MSDDAMAEHGDAEREGLTPAQVRGLAQVDLRGAIAWCVLGAAVLIASLRMDRLEQQNINPYTVPGLLPGLLGIVMMLLGTLLGVRSWRRGARPGELRRVAVDRTAVVRVALVIALCVAFGVGLVGHGVPFWLAAALFVTVAIVTLQQPQRTALGKRLGVRDVAMAALIGLGAGAAITLVFQSLFLVRLP